MSTKLGINGRERLSSRNRVSDWNLTNWYFYEPESVLDNEKYKILSDFEIKTDNRNENQTQW